MAPAPSKHAATAPGAVPWPDAVLCHADVGPELHARLDIKPLVALIGTCKAARDSIAFKPAEARAALAEHGKDWLCTHAAGKGNLRLLEWACAQGCLFNACWTCDAAAGGGQLACLQYAHEHGSEWSGSTCNAAAVDGQLACLMYAHEQGCPWDEYTCTDAALGAHLDCLAYAHEHGCPWGVSTCAEAARGGQLVVLKWLHEQKPEFARSGRTRTVALNSGWDHVVAWLDTLGVQRSCNS